MIFQRIILNLAKFQPMNLASSMRILSTVAKWKKSVARSLTFPESDLWKFPSEPRAFRIQVCLLTSSSLLFETSVESRFIPSLHLVLSGLLNLLPDLGFLLAVLPLLPCFSSWNSFWLKSSVRKTNKTWIRRTFEIKGEEEKFITFLRNSNMIVSVFIEYSGPYNNTVKISRLTQTSLLFRNKKRRTII